MKAQIVSARFMFGFSRSTVPIKCLLFESSGIAIHLKPGRLRAYTDFNKDYEYEVLQEVEVPEDLLDRAEAVILAQKRLDALAFHVEEILR